MYITNLLLKNPELCKESLLYTVLLNNSYDK